MIFNASRGGNMTLTDHDFNRALELLTTTERSMAKTFAGVGKSDFASIMNRVLQTLVTRRQVKYSELLQTFYYDADDQVLGNAVATLERAKLVRVEKGDIEDRRDYYVIYSAGEDIP
jgi:hypothetical protein